MENGRTISPRGLDRAGLLCNNTFELAGNPLTAEPAIALSPDPNYDPNPTGNQQKKFPYWLIGVLLLAVAITVTVGTSGAVYGAAFLVHGVAKSATIGGVTGAVLGTVSGGIEYDSDGKLSWNWEGASKGFMWGAITGVVAGAASGGFLKVGENLAKPIYALIQIAGNAGISASVDALQGLITNQVSVESMLISAGFGAMGGLFGAKFGTGRKSDLLNVGLKTIEGVIRELLEILRKKNIKPVSYNYALAR